MNATLHLFVVVSCMGLLALGCNVPVLGPAPEGIHVPASGSFDACGRGFLVAQSDYQSSNISAYGLNGDVLSPSLASSNVRDAGLVQAFSGDVVFPSMRQIAEDIVVLDRYPQSVLTYINPLTAHVRAQLDVSMGFAANPHDYLSIDEHHAIVSRFDANPRKGTVAHDAGGDWLIVDPLAPEITGSISLEGKLAKATSTLLPHPDRMVLVNSRVYAVVSLYSTNYQQTGASYVVVIDAKSLQIERSVELVGVSGCAGIALSPSGEEIAVACSGAWGSAKGASAQSSAILGLSVADTPEERFRITASSVGTGAAFGFSLGYADSDQLLFVQLGTFDDAGQVTASDRLYSFSVNQRKTELLHEAKNEAFVLGDVRCLPECGRCASAQAGNDAGLSLWQVQKSTLSQYGMARMQDGTGLPPRWLGMF